MGQSVDMFLQSHIRSFHRSLIGTEMRLGLATAASAVGEHPTRDGSK